MRTLARGSSVLLLLMCASIVCANTITVTGTGDSLANDGVCTLREAVINANNNAATWTDCAAGSGADVINLPAGTITLSINGRGEEFAATGDIDILDSVTINGNSGGTTLNAGGIDRFFDINSRPFSDPPRPAITVAIHNVTITGGVVQGDGGGFRVNANATVTVDGVTVTGNSSNNDGAGVKVESDGTLTMTNSTISGNSTALLIGGLRNDGTTTLAGCTVTNNSALAGRGNGLGGYGIATKLRNTIVVANNNQPDGEGGFTSLGYNIVGNLGLGMTITATTGDQFGVTPAQVILGVLQNNGGPTPTHALGSGSVAIDKGDSSGLTTDQRGSSRPCDDVTISNASGGDGADIGAFEVQGCATNHAPTAVDDNATVLEDSVGNIIDVLANDSDSDGDSLTITNVTQGTHGSVANNSTSVSYTPAPLFFGSDSFTYTISDGHGGQATATVHVTVTHVNHPPHANADSYSVIQDTTLNVAAPGVLGNDTDVDGDVLHAVLVSNLAYRSVVLNANGSFFYTPVPSFGCVDSFTYKANDGAADSNVVAVTINVIDTQAPSITASTSLPLLWPANHSLVNVGFTFNATDNGCGGVVTQLSIFSDEPDVPSSGDDSNFSPDARSIGAGTLRLRAERAEGNGRVYLIRVTATDSSANKSNNCVAVVVPKSNSPNDANKAKARGQSAASQCTATGQPPMGYVVVGGGSVIGPKQ